MKYTITLIDTKLHTYTPTRKKYLNYIYVEFLNYFIIHTVLHLFLVLIYVNNKYCVDKKCVNKFFFFYYFDFMLFNK